MRYPVIGAPPSKPGAVHARSIRAVPSAVAIRPVGAFGTVASVVALASFEAAPTPARLIAETR